MKNLFLLAFVILLSCSNIEQSYISIEQTMSDNPISLALDNDTVKYGSSGIWSDKDLSKLSSLTKGHTEKRRGQRIIKKSNGSHGGTVGA